MSMFIYKGGGGVKNGQNLVYVIKVWPLQNRKSKMDLDNGRVKFSITIFGISVTVRNASVIRLSVSVFGYEK